MSLRPRLPGTRRRESAVENNWQKYLSLRSPLITRHNRRALKDENEAVAVEDFTSRISKGSLLDWQQMVGRQSKETRRIFFKDTEIVQRVQENKKWAYASGYIIAPPSPFSDLEIESKDEADSDDQMKPSSPTIHFRTCSSQLNQSRTTRSHLPANGRRLHKPTFTVVSSNSKSRCHRKRAASQSLQRQLRAHHSADSLPALSTVAVSSPVRGPRGGKKRSREDENSTEGIEEDQDLAASLDEKIDVDGDTEMANDERFSIIDPKGPMKV